MQAPPSRCPFECGFAPQENKSRAISPANSPDKNEGNDAASGTQSFPEKDVVTVKDNKSSRLFIFSKHCSGLQ